MKVYDSIIEICLDPVCKNEAIRDDKAQRELGHVRGIYFKPAKAAPMDTTTQERSLIQLFWERASFEYKVARENGYVGTDHNCVLRLLYGVFGLDIIGYLFNRSWVPATTIDPFRPDVFLERLSVLEQAAADLTDGWKTPVKLPETTAYFRPGMGPKLSRFSEERHRLLLDYSLRELRAFGELG
jgi:hypothetical protein